MQLFNSSVHHKGHKKFIEILFPQKRINNLQVLAFTVSNVSRSMLDVEKPIAYSYKLRNVYNMYFFDIYIYIHVYSTLK